MARCGWRRRSKHVNTELRELTEARLFDYVDFVTLDDGERPLLALIEHLQGQRPRLNSVRTFVCVDSKVRYFKSDEVDVPFAEVGTPTWDGLALHQTYLKLMQRAAISSAKSTAFLIETST